MPIALRPTPRQNGFTMIEMLVTLVVGSVVLLGALSWLVSHFRYFITLDASARLKDRWAQVNHLLDYEISEAESISDPDEAGPIPVDPLDPCSSDVQGLAISMRLDIRDVDRGETTVPIYYALDADGTLLRCGPPIDPDGSLDFAAAPVASALVPNAQLDVDLPAGTIPTGQRPGYTLTLTDPISGARYANRVSAGRARVRVIDD